MPPLVPTSDISLLALLLGERKELSAREDLFSFDGTGWMSNIAWILRQAKVSFEFSGTRRSTRFVVQRVSPLLSF